MARKTPDWDSALKALTSTGEATDIADGRIRDECWAIAVDYLSTIQFVDMESGVTVDDLPDEIHDQVVMFTATGIWLGMVAADDLDFIKHGGHQIANRLRRLRSSLASRT